MLSKLASTKYGTGPGQPHAQLALVPSSKARHGEWTGSRGRGTGKGTGQGGQGREVGRVSQGFGARASGVAPLCGGL